MNARNRYAISESISNLQSALVNESWQSSINESAILTAPPSGATPILDRQKLLPALVTSSGSHRAVTFGTSLASGVVLGVILANPVVRGGLREWLSGDELHPLGVAASISISLVAGIRGIVK